MLEGSPDTEYDGGLYHGKIMFPPKFPYAPPSITMLTPNGRFKPGMYLPLPLILSLPISFVVVYLLHVAPCSGYV